MRNIFFVIMCFFCFFVSCDMVAVNKIRKNNYVRDENYEEIADGITYKVARKLKKENNLQCIGTGGGMMDDIQEMGISFDLFFEVDLVEARKLLVHVVSEYIMEINGNKEIRPYLHSYPFKPENIQVMMWVREPDGHDVSVGKIDFMSSVRGILKYKVVTRLDPYSNEKICEETYEEALQIVKEQEEASQPQAS